jgi:hypothetical protein
MEQRAQYPQMDPKLQAQHGGRSGEPQSNSLNIIQQADSAKNLSDQQIRQAFQSGGFMPYILLAEMQNRKAVRADAQSEAASNTTTVAEELMGGQDRNVDLANAPQADPRLQQMHGGRAGGEGIPGAQQQPQYMAEGGIVGFQDGGDPRSVYAEQDEKAGMLKEYLARNPKATITDLVEAFKAYGVTSADAQNAIKETGRSGIAEFEATSPEVRSSQAEEKVVKERLADQRGIYEALDKEESPVLESSMEVRDDTLSALGIEAPAVRDPSYWGKEGPVGQTIRDPSYWGKEGPVGQTIRDPSYWGKEGPTGKVLDKNMEVRDDTLSALGIEAPKVRGVDYWGKEGPVGQTIRDPSYWGKEGPMAQALKGWMEPGGITEAISDPRQDVFKGKGESPPLSVPKTSQSRARDALIEAGTGPFDLGQLSPDAVARKERAASAAASTPFTVVPSQGAGYEDEFRRESQGIADPRITEDALRKKRIDLIKSKKQQLDQTGILEDGVGAGAGGEDDPILTAEAQLHASKSGAGGEDDSISGKVEKLFGNRAFMFGLNLWGTDQSGFGAAARKAAGEVVKQMQTAETLKWKGRTALASEARAIALTNQAIVQASATRNTNLQAQLVSLGRRITDLRTAKSKAVGEEAQGVYEGQITTLAGKINDITDEMQSAGNTLNKLLGIKGYEKPRKKREGVSKDAKAAEALLDSNPEYR